MPYKSTELEVNKLLMYMLQRGASDLHLIAGKPPTIRVDSDLIELKDHEVLSGNSIATMVDVLLETDEKTKELRDNRELDFSFSFKDNIRFRLNAYYQNGFLSPALPLLPPTLHTLQPPNFPPHL